MDEDRAPLYRQSMASVSQFAQYLLKLDPQRNPARLTLFNFLKHVAEPTLPFSPAILQAFYGRALQFDYWQSEYQSLSDTTRADVLGFLKQQPLEHQADAWAQIRHPDTLQVVPIKLFQDLQELVENEHDPRRRSGEQIKVVKLSDTQVLVAILAATGALEVKVYPNLAIVLGAHLRLMSPEDPAHGAVPWSTFIERGLGLLREERVIEALEEGRRKLRRGRRDEESCVRRTSGRVRRRLPRRHRHHALARSLRHQAPNRRGVPIVEARQALQRAE